MSASGLPGKTPTSASGARRRAAAQVAGDAGARAAGAYAVVVLRNR